MVSLISGYHVFLKNKLFMHKSEFQIWKIKTRRMLMPIGEGTQVY